MKTINTTQLKGNPKRGLITAILALFMGYSTVSFFGATAPVMKAGMPLSPDEVGLLVAIPALTGGLMRIPAAAWADMNGGRKPTLILLCTTLIGLCSFAVIAKIYPDGAIPKSMYPLLLFLGALVGTGIGVFTVGVAHVTYWFHTSYSGRALGLYGGLGGIAGGLVTATITFGISKIGFFGIYLLWFVVTLLGTIVYFFFSANPYFYQLRQMGVPLEEAKSEARQLGQQVFPIGGKMIDSFKFVIKSARCWGMSFVYLSTFGGSVALITWLPTFFTAHYGVSLKMAGLLTGLSAILSPLFRIVSGFWSDKHSAEHASIFALILSFCAATVLAFSSSIVLSFICICLMIIGIGFSNGALFKLIPIYVKGAVGTASGMIGGLGAIGGFILPPILGTIVVHMGEVGYARGFLVFSFILLLSLIAMILLYRDSRKNHIEGV